MPDYIRALERAVSAANYSAVKAVSVESGRFCFFILKRIALKNIAPGYSGIGINSYCLVSLL